MGRPKFTVGDLHVEADCDLAYSRSIDRVSGIDRRGKPFDLTVRVTEVYRKIGDKWLIVHEHSSAPVDLAAGEPDLTSTP